jgi:hypothetical protein
MTNGSLYGPDEEHGDYLPGGPEGDDEDEDDPTEYDPDYSDESDGNGYH